MVGLAFAVAASTFCPLLVLGIWWPRLTAAGALAGLAVGGVGSGAAVLWTLAVPAASDESWGAVLLGSPAAWSVPAAFLTMVTVSRFGRPPRTALRSFVRLHTPEAVRLDRG